VRATSGRASTLGPDRFSERHAGADIPSMNPRRGRAVLLVGSLALALAPTVVAWASGVPSGGHASLRTAPAYRPDAWIKLCGLSTGCTIDPPPHPWLGNDVYNDSGRRQAIGVRMEDGEGVRYWITLQNDGIQPDTLTLDGCKGNRRFVVNKVQLGEHRRPDAGSTKITRQFIRGTATFDLPPSSKAVVTLNILAPTTAEGVTYRCPVIVRSAGDPAATDAVVAEMTTY
jgi:hypothetical protein